MRSNGSQKRVIFHHCVRCVAFEYVQLFFRIQKNAFILTEISSAHSSVSLCRAMPRHQMYTLRFPYKQTVYVDSLSLGLLLSMPVICMQITKTPPILNDYAELATKCSQMNFLPSILLLCFLHFYRFLFSGSWLMEVSATVNYIARERKKSSFHLYDSNRISPFPATFAIDCLFLFAQKERKKNCLSWVHWLACFAYIEKIKLKIGLHVHKISKWREKNVFYDQKQQTHIKHKIKKLTPQLNFTLLPHRCAQFSISLIVKNNRRNNVISFIMTFHLDVRFQRPLSYSSRLNS